MRGLAIGLQAFARPNLGQSFLPVPETAHRDPCKDFQRYMYLVAVATVLFGAAGRSMVPGGVRAEELVDGAIVLGAAGAALGPTTTSRVGAGTSGSSGGRGGVVDMGGTDAMEPDRSSSPGGTTPALVIAERLSRGRRGWMWGLGVAVAVAVTVVVAGVSVLVAVAAPGTVDEGTGDAAVVLGDISMRGDMDTTACTATGTWNAGTASRGGGRAAWGSPSGALLLDETRTEVVCSIDSNLATREATRLPPGPGAVSASAEVSSAAR